MSMLTERELKLKSVQYRKDILRIIKASGAGHTGGDLSSIDILNVLYNRILRVTPETLPTRTTTIMFKARGIVQRLCSSCSRIAVTFPRATWIP